MKFNLIVYDAGSEKAKCPGTLCKQVCMLAFMECRYHQDTYLWHLLCSPFMVIDMIFVKCNFPPCTSMQKSVLSSVFFKQLPWLRDSPTLKVWHLKVVMGDKNISAWDFEGLRTSVAWCLLANHPTPHGKHAKLMCTYANRQHFLPLANLVWIQQPTLPAMKGIVKALHWTRDEGTAAQMSGCVYNVLVKQQHVFHLYMYTYMIIYIYI